MKSVRLTLIVLALWISLSISNVSAAAREWQGTSNFQLQALTCEITYDIEEPPGTALFYRVDVSLSKLYPWVWIKILRLTIVLREHASPDSNGTQLLLLDMVSNENVSVGWNSPWYISSRPRQAGYVYLDFSGDMDVKTAEGNVVNQVANASILTAVINAPTYLDLQYDLHALNSSHNTLLNDYENLKLTYEPIGQLANTRFLSIVFLVTTIILAISVVYLRKRKASLS